MGKIADDRRKLREIVRRWKEEREMASQRMKSRKEIRGKERGIGNDVTLRRCCGRSARAA